MAYMYSFTTLSVQLYNSHPNNYTKFLPHSTIPLCIQLLLPYNLQLPLYHLSRSTSWRLHELKNIHTQLFFTSNACMPIAVFLTAKAFSARVAVYFTCIGSHLPPVPSQEFIHGHLVEISFHSPKDDKRPPDNA